MVYPRFVTRLALVLIPPVVFVGCGQECTEVGCFENQLVLSVMDSDGAAVMEFGLAVSTPDGQRAELTCAPEESDSFICCEQTGGELRLDTSCTPGEFHRLQLPSRLDTLRFELVAPDGRAADTTVDLVWDEFYPNGEDCGGACDTTAVDLVL